MKIKNSLLVFLIFLFVQNVFCEETMNLQNEEIRIEQIQIEKIELEQVESKKNKSKINEDFSLFEIDKLIRATEYDKALKQLKIYIEKNPLKFDLAQSRIKKIMKARQNYSELANRLIQLIQTDPGNDKEIYEITTTLESFEKNPSDENLKFIADLKKSAEFNYFRSMFMQIQEEAALLAKQGQYTEAVTKIKDGFWLYKEEFYTKWQNDQNIIAQVNEILKNIDNLLYQFCDNGFQKKLTDSVDSFVKSVSYGNYENSLEKFNESVVYFNKLQTLIAGFIEAENQLQGIFENLQKIDNDTSDASFIPFVSRFITGLSSVERSGILGALETQWQININKMTVALAQNTSELYKDYSMSFNKSVFKNKSVINSEKSKRERNVIKNNYNLVEKIYNLDLTVYGKFERYNGSVVAVDYSSAKYLVLLSQNIYDLCLKAEKIDINEKFDKPNLIISKIAEINNAVGVKSELQLENKDEFIQYKNNNLTEWNYLTEKYNEYIEELFATSQELSLSGWNALKKSYQEECIKLYSQITEKMQVANYINNGFVESISYENQNKYIKNAEQIFADYSVKNQKVVEADVLYNYPDICLAVFGVIQNNIEENIAKLQTNQTGVQNDFEVYGAQNATTEINNVISIILEDFSKTTANLNEQKSILQKLLAQNEQKIIQAQLAQNEADMRFTEAQNALKSEKFEIARQKLQDALSKYDESLSIQNNALLRNQCDEKLFALGNEIARQENQIVVVEVRQLKNDARDAYFNGRFEDAEKYLTQAKNRWEITNVDPDEEIENLMNLINNAILMHTGREVLPSDPLYPEMSQLLNIAYQYYDEGYIENKKGNTAKSTELLNLAIEKLQSIQIAYPIHQEAALLTLKINKLKDPNKFESEFEQKIKTAKAMCKNKSTQKEGYTNLLDYYAMEPNYKGLKDLIYQVEIDIGIRQKKVENTELKRSQNIVAEAKKLFDKAGDDQDKLKKALDKINQAIRLNPDNKDATALKDKITTKIGGTTSAVLSTEDERLYQMAVKKLQQNDVIGANAITMQLLKKKQNMSSKKIRDLKNKIDARL